MTGFQCDTKLPRMLQDLDSMIGRNKKGRSNIQNTHEKFRISKEDFFSH